MVWLDSSLHVTVSNINEEEQQKKKIIRYCKFHSLMTKDTISLICPSPFKMVIIRVSGKDLFTTSKQHFSKMYSSIRIFECFISSSHSRFYYWLSCFVYFGSSPILCVDDFFNVKFNHQDRIMMLAQRVALDPNILCEKLCSVLGMDSLQNYPLSSSRGVLAQGLIDFHCLTLYT